MNELIGIYGASGFGREVLSVLRRSTPVEHVAFIDDGATDSEVNGAPTLDWDGFLARPAGVRRVIIAIADGQIRARLWEKCRQAGIAQADLVAENAFIGDTVAYGEGVVIQPFVTLTANVSIGRGFHANIYSYVAHDCVIGDFVTFAPGVKCNGNVTIGDCAYIGTGAVLKQGRPGKPLTIGADAVVGMGAVVTKDVPPGITVVGNPARELVRRD